MSGPGHQKKPGLSSWWVALVAALAAGIAPLAPAMAQEAKVEAKPTAASPPSSSVPTVGVRGGSHADHSRVVFDWTSAVTATIERQPGEQGDRVTIRFNKQAKANLTDLARAKLARVSAVTQENGDGGLVVTFTVPTNAEVSQSRVGDKVVLDIGNARPAAAVKTAAAKPDDKKAPDKAGPKAEPKAESKAEETKGSSAKPPAPDTRAAKEGAPLYQLRPAPSGPSAASGPAPAKGEAKPESPAAAPPPAVSSEKPVPAAQGLGAAGLGPSAAAVGTAFPTVRTQGTVDAPVDAPQSPSMVFNPGVPTGVAIFSRAGWLYVLFDRDVPANTAPTKESLPPLMGAVESVPFPGGKGFRVPLPAMVEPHASRQGTAWRISLDRPGQVPTNNGLAIVPDPTFALGSRLLVKLAAPAKVMPFTDPTAGDTLSVVPLSQDGQSVPLAHAYAQAHFLQTAQGVVVRPIDERLIVEQSRDGLEVSVPGGLRLSPADDSLVAAPAEQPQATPDRYFDFQKWSRMGHDTFIQGRQELMAALMEMPPEEKTKGRLALARFYAGWGFGEEALSLLEQVRKQQPDIENRPEFLAVRGTARILTGHMQDGLADLANPSLKNERDVPLWQAYAAHATGDDLTANRLFNSRKELLKTYPEPFATRFSLAAAETALANRDPASATAVLDRLTRRGLDKGQSQTAILFLKGQAQRLAGDDAKALDFYHQAAEGTDRLYRTKARLAQIEEGSKLGHLTPKQAAEEMEKLRFAWTGDALEQQILRKLGDAHLKAGEYPQAFDTMKRALTLYPDSPDAPVISKEMTDAFMSLFVRDEASKIPPLQALSLYEQYKELTPPGPDGDTVIRILAERLVDVDLLDRAADLLDRQVTYRLQGEQKGRVGAREAAIRLLNSQPDRALEALDKSEVPDQPADIAQERRLLRARALAKLGRGAEAVALLQTDQSRPANLMRIDVAWHAKQWPAAAQALADVIGPPPAPGQALEPGVSSLVVNRAVAMALAQDLAGLQKLRADFGAAMEKTPDADMFKVVTRPQEATGLLDAATIQAQVKEIDLFKDFLNSYRKRTAAPDGTTDAGAAGAGAKPAPAGEAGAKGGGAPG